MAKTRIYLVEDDALSAGAICHRLAHLGYELCGQTARGENILEAISQARPDLVVMDSSRACGRTGIESAVRLRHRLHLPVVFLGAAADVKLMEADHGDRPLGSLFKPFEDRELHATLQAVLYQHRLEKLLREGVRPGRGAALLRRTCEIARIGGWELAIRSLELTWSAEVFRIHEVEATRRPTLTEAIAFYDPEARPIMEAAVRQAMQDGTPFDLELPLTTAKGRRIWVRVQAEAEWDQESGARDKFSGPEALHLATGTATFAREIVRLVGSVQDITERKAASEALRRSETRFRTLYDATSDAVMVLDEQRFLDCNPATLVIFGCASREEFCAKHPADVSPAQQPCGRDSYTLANLRIATAMKQGCHAFEWLHCRVDTGEPFPAEVLLTAMQLDGRKVLQAVVRNITERKRTEAVERARQEQLLRFQSTLLTLRDYSPSEARSGVEGQGAGEHPAYPITIPSALSGFFRLATEQVARALGVARVGIWFFDDAHAAIVCHDLFQQSSGQHEAGQRLLAADFPAYFEACSQSATVLADDACTHPATCQFADVYLKPNGIVSMMDVPVRLGSEVAGVLCCEQTWPGRHWTPEEEKFAIAAAATILLAWDNERRRQAEAALRESEIRSRNVAEAANEGIFFHENGVIFDANPELCRMAGHRLDELVGKECLELAAPELRAELSAKLASGNIQRYETVGLRKDGGRFPIEISARNTVHLGRPVRVVCVRDLTELRFAAIQLRENEARLQRVMEGSQQGYWDWNVLTRDVTFSDRWFTMLGYLPSDLEQNFETWEYLLHPEEKPHVLAALKAHAEGRADRFEVELRMRTKSGDWRWILSRGHVVCRDAAGQAVYVSGTHTDITERKEIEARLRERESLLSSINTNLVGSAVFRYQLSPAGQLSCTYVSPNVGAFLGVEPAVVLAKPEILLAHILPEDLPAIQAEIRRCAETGEGTSYTVRLSHPAGGIRWIHFRGHLVERWPDGTQVRDGIATDVTAIKETEAEVRRQAEFLDALHQTTLDLLDRRERRDLMQAIVQRAAALLDSPFCEMMLKENPPCEITDEAGEGKPEGTISQGEELVVVALTHNQPYPLGRRLRRAEAPLSWRAHDTARPVVVTDYSTESERPGIYASLPLHAVAEFPILHGNACLGVLSLGRAEAGRTFSAEEIQRGEMLAKKAALVIHNASIYADAVREVEQRTVELRESEELYRSLVETSPAAIIVSDFQGQVLKVNQRTLEMFDDGNDPPESGRSMFDWVAPGEITRLRTELARLMQSGSVRDVAAVLLRHGNRPFDALIDGVIIKDATGAPKSVMFQIQDITERLRAERALAESEEKYRGLVTSMNDGVFVADALGRLTFGNLALARLMGLQQPEQVVGRSFFDFVAPAMIEEIQGYFQHTIETGSPRDATTVEIVRPDGTSAVVEVKYLAVKADNQVVGMKGVIRDITKQQRAEQALTSAHRRTTVLAQLGRELAEAATPRMAALSILQAARQLIDWDSSWLHVWNPKQDQFEDLANFDLVDGERRDVSANPVALRDPSPMVRRVMQEGAQLLLREAETDHAEGFRPFGSPRRSLSLMFVPIRLADQFVGILSIQSYRPQAYDQAALHLLQTLADHCAGALARIQATAALAASVERFRLVWENATDGMRLTDGEGRIVAANDAFCRLVGKPRKDVEGQLLSTLYAEPENLKILARYQERFARHELLTRVEANLTLADRRAIWLGVSNCFIETDPARPLLLGIFRDITERKLSEQALRFLSAGIANLSGESFFNAVACHLATLLDVEIGFVGKLLLADSRVPGPESRVQSPELQTQHSEREIRNSESSTRNAERGTGNPHIRTLGLCVDGASQPAVDYSVAGTPCEAVIGKRPAIYPNHVTELFPGDRMLAELRVASYASIPLADKVGRPIGHLGIMSRQPMHNPSQVEAILQLFAVRVAAEIERQRAERRFHDLFEFSPDAILLTKKDGQIMMANQQAERLFGFAPGELLGQFAGNLLPAAKAGLGSGGAGPEPRVSSPAARVARDAQAASLQTPASRPQPPAFRAASRPDLWAIKKDGTEFPVDLSLNPLESDTGFWVAATIRDLTELRRAQQQMLRAQRLESIGTLAGGVAHDLNNALAPIVVATELLHEKYPHARELIDIMSSSAHRAANMVKQLLTFARGVEGARLLIQPLHLLKDMEKIIKSTFPKNIELRSHYEPNLQTILGDATQLHQVLLNLCVNARDAMPQGGTLTLTAQNVDLDDTAAGAIAEARPGHYVVWRVTDTGSGISPEILERIFEPFFTTKGLAQGTGLGLSTAIGIAKSHGGFIQVHSQPGQGATFAVYLPASDTGTVPAARAT